MSHLRSQTLSGLAVTVLAMTLTAAPLFAQAEEPGVFGEVIDVRVVNIEVVVTEDGNRVSGLGPDDFRLTVDGKELPIEYFTEVLGGTAVVPEADATGGTVPALAPGEEVGTSYLVFIDEYFTRLNDRNRALDRLKEELPYLLPGDRMAIVAYNGKEIDMLTTWSQSIEELERVVRKARERPSFGTQREAEVRIYDFSRRIGEDAFGRTPRGRSTSAAGLDIEQRQLADLISSQVERVVLAASSTLRSFANPPGRKVMMLFSGGWPYNPDFWVVNEIDQALYTGTGYRDGERLYRTLTDTANRLSYTLYTVDMPGVDSSTVTAEVSGLEAANYLASLDRDRELDEHLTLRTLARDTGGRALIDSSGAAAFQRVVEDTRSYYWIGFTPNWQGDDTRHKVEVEPRRKGLKIRSRKGFSDLSRETEVTMMVESSLRFGNPPSAAPLGAAIGPGQKAGRGKVTVPLQVMIPVGELTFLPQSDAWVAETELRVAVLDEDGNTADIPVIPLGIRVRGEPEASDATIFETSLKLRKRKHNMVVSLYDKGSGKILSTKIEVDPQVNKRKK